MFNQQHIDLKCQGGISVTFASLFISQGKLHNSLGPLQTNKKRKRNGFMLLKHLWEREWLSRAAEQFSYNGQ